MIKKLAVISIWAEDVPTTVHFYRDVLGLKLLDQHGDRPHFYLDGVYLTILRGRPTPAQDSIPDCFPLFAFAVDNLDAAVMRLRAHNIDILEEGQDSASRWVMFHDPAGNLIELVQFG